jgi:hypothetical protein
MKPHTRKSYTRKDGTKVRATYVKGKSTGWIQAVNTEMENKHTEGSFTRAKLAAGYPNTKRGTVDFANAVLKGKIKGKNTTLWHRRAALAKVFVRIANKR